MQGTAYCRISFPIRSVPKNWFPVSKKITFLSKNKKCVSPNISGLTHFCYTIFLWSFLPSCHFSPDSAKKARGCSATGFTQKRHTLYAYYSRGKSEFQMIFSHPMPLFIPYYFEKTAAMWCRTTMLSRSCPPSEAVPSADSICTITAAIAAGWLLSQAAFSPRSVLHAENNHRPFPHKANLPRF